MSGGGERSPEGGGPALVGLGSPHGDDQVGWAAVDRLRPRLPASVVAVKAAGGLEVLDLLIGHDDVIVVDAAAPAGRPGAIRSFEWPICELPDSSCCSTHGFGLVEALRLAETLDRLPRRVRIATVEAQGTLPGAPLSDAAEQGLVELVESILTHFVVLDGASAGEGRCTRRS